MSTATDATSLAPPSLRDGSSDLPASVVAEATKSRVDSTTLTQALSVLENVISLRKAASVFFRQHSSSNELFDRHNEGHLHVIEVLEDVQRILEPLRPVAREQPQPDATAIPSASTTSVGNLFDALEVEEIDEPTCNQDSVTGSKARQKKAKTVAAPHKGERFELGTSEEDLYFILFTFFKDLNDIRRVLRETWEGYRDGTIPLMSASVTTDLAFEVVKQKERSFLDTDVLLSNGEQTTLQAAFTKVQRGKVASGVDLYWRSMDDSLMYSTYLGDLLFSFVSEVRHNARAIEQEPDEVTMRMYELADWLCIPGHIILRVHKMGVDGKKGEGLPIDYRQSAGDTAGERARKAFEDDFDVFGNMFLDLIQLRAQNRVPNTLDAWTRGICELLPVGDGIKARRTSPSAASDVPAWLVWASTVFFDIKHVLGPSDGRGFQELRETGKLTTRMLNARIKWSNGMFDPAWNEHHDTILLALGDFVATYVEGDMAGMVARLGQSSLREPNAPHYLFKRHPLWCGILTFQLNLSLWTAGIELTNIWRSFFSASQLYNMAVHEAKRGQKFEWPDLEYLIALHGEQYLFFGGRPTKPTEYMKRFILAMGVSKEHVASGMAKGTGLLRPDAITSNMLQSRYHAVRLTPPPTVAEPTTSQILLAFSKQHPQRDLDNPSRPVHGLVPMLAAARQGVSADIPHLYFDYFSMHMRGWELLKSLQRELHPELALIGELEGDDHISGDEDSLRGITFCVLQTMNFCARGGSPENPLMAMVPRTVAVIRQFAREQGSVENDEVKRRVTGESAGILPSGMPSQYNEGDFDGDESDDESVSSAEGDEGQVSRRQMNEAVRLLKKISQADIPAHARALAGILHSKGADLSRNELVGGMGTLAGVIEGLPEHAMEEIMATQEMAKVMQILRGNEPRSYDGGSPSFDIAEMEVKKRNNKNKNKNRKAKQKAARDAQAVSGAEQQAASSSSNGDKTASQPNLAHRPRNNMEKVLVSSSGSLSSRTPTVLGSRQGSGDTDAESEDEGSDYLG
ncbi:hypothetical protein LTR36_001329 [Oleoguttula mirabilis]|uniref:DUF6604 domain-containing protein n=1 Tax=Oleoguttula mirabilis TaxID=1507867 RepID=A0AAV9JNG9_9PEZI|nr:hypothetical protein LTR36_001329 [Oleoguttula mirabilis]